MKKCFNNYNNLARGSIFSAEIFGAFKQCRKLSRRGPKYFNDFCPGVQILHKSDNYFRGAYFVSVQDDIVSSDILEYKDECLIIKSCGK